MTLEQSSCRFLERGGQLTLSLFEFAVTTAKAVYLVDCESAQIGRFIICGVGEQPLDRVHLQRRRGHSLRQDAVIDWSDKAMHKSAGLRRSTRDSHLLRRLDRAAVESESESRCLDEQRLPSVEAVPRRWLLFFYPRVATRVGRLLRAASSTSAPVRPRVRCFFARAKAFFQSRISSLAGWIGRPVGRWLKKPGWRGAHLNTRQRSPAATSPFWDDPATCVAAPASRQRVLRPMLRSILVSPRFLATSACFARRGGIRASLRRRQTHHSTPCLRLIVANSMSLDHETAIINARHGQSAANDLRTTQCFGDECMSSNVFHP